MSDQRLNISLTDLEERLSITDLIDANIVLDARDDLEALAKRPTH